MGYDIFPATLSDKTLQELPVWRKTGVNCIGIKDAEGKFLINPPEGILTSGMKVIVPGNREQIEEMRNNVDDQQ